MKLSLSSLFKRSDFDHYISNRHSGTHFGKACSRLGNSRLVSGKKILEKVRKNSRNHDLPKCVPEGRGRRLINITVLKYRCINLFLIQYFFSGFVSHMLDIQYNFFGLYQSALDPIQFFWIVSDFSWSDTKFYYCISADLDPIQKFWIVSRLIFIENISVGFDLCLWGEVWRRQWAEPIFNQS